MKNEEKKSYKISEVAKMFDIHEDTLRKWEKDGLITPIRIGKRGDRRYTQEHIDVISGLGLATKIRTLDANNEVFDNKMTLSQLKQFLWKSADILRGRVDGSQYKEYIFALLFFKRMSDIWDEEYKKILDEFHDEALAVVDYNHRFNVPKDCKWSVIADQSENIGAKLNEIFDKITNANSPKLDKIFSKLDFADKDRFPTETMQQLVNHFSQYNFGDQYINSDILGDAYEYLIEQFAAGAGKKGGEFYTPREIERLIMHILDPHEKDHIYDPTVGSGGFLLEAYHYVRDKYNETKARSLYLYGQEFNMSTFTIARINMFLHGLDSADIRMGDTLANPKFLTNDNQLQTFDICVSNFPYSIKEWAREEFASNSFGRLDGYEMPPAKNADYAFILHIIKSLNENGKAGIVVPHGTLFKTDASGRIREQILKNDLIEAVIALPAKLFYGVGIPVAVIILNKNKSEERKNKVLIIDAENEYQSGKNQNRLRVKDIEKTSNTFHEFKDVERFARVVDLVEIKKNDFNLNIRRYVDASEPREEIDVSEEWKKLQEIEDEAREIDKEVETFFGVDRLEVPEGTDTKVGDILTLEYGKPLSKSERNDQGKYPVFGANGIKAWSNKFYCDKPGIIVGRKGSAGEVTLTDKKFWPLDVTYFVTFDEEKYDLYFLYALLKSLDLPSLAVGVKPGINRDEVYSLKVTIPSLEVQKKIAEVLRSVDTYAKATKKVIDQTERVKMGLMQDLLSGKVSTL